MSKVRSSPPSTHSPNPPSATFSEMLFPFLCLPTHPLYPSTPSQLSSEVSARANQALIHLKLTGRADYGDGFLLQKSYQHHLYRNTCRNMKELPSSISRSIVCQVCQTNWGQIILYAPEPRSLSHAVCLKGTDFKQTHGWRGGGDIAQRTQTQFNSGHCHFSCRITNMEVLKLQDETQSLVSKYERGRWRALGSLSCMKGPSFRVLMKSHPSKKHTLVNKLYLKCGIYRLFIVDYFRIPLNCI